MRTHLLAASLCVLLTACGSDSSSSDTPSNQTALAPVDGISAAQLAQIDDYMQAQMSRRQVPGLALVVTMNGKPVLEKGYGAADLASGAKVTPDTVFQIGSITKQFTATAIMLLVQDGRLNLDDPVTRHLPTAPQAWSGITIRHLLNHTSGLTRDFPASLLAQLDGRALPPIDTLVALAADTERHAQPGVAHSYSNVGYHLLGFVVEKVSGLHFAELLRQRAFIPLGMGTAAMISTPAPASAATGYSWTGSEQTPASGTMATPGFMEGEGGLRMSARDLAKWDAALLGESILSRASLAQMHAPTTLADGSGVGYGFGWALGEINGHSFTWHNGALEGFRSQFSRHGSDEGLGVIVLTNASGAPVEAIAARVAAIVKPQLDHVILPDPEPPLGQLLRSVADDLLRGTLVADERFAPQLRAALTPEALTSFQAYFADLGPVEQFGYLGEIPGEGGAVRRYLVRSRLEGFILYARLDAEGRLETLGYSGQ